MQYTNTVKPKIDEEVKANKDNKFIYQNLCLKYNVGNIQFHKDLILDNYRDVIMGECFEFDLDFNGRFEEKYKYKPKAVSFDVYDTIDLWWLLLWINDMSSSREFTKSTIKIFSPESINILNKIFILEKDKLIDSKANPIKV